MHSRLVGSLIVFAVGCGGNVVFSGDGGSGGGSTASGVDEVSSGSVTPGSTGSSGTGSSGTGDTGTSGSTTTGGQGSSGTGTTPVVIDCFGSTCDGATEQCCATQSTADCTPIGSDCPGLVLHCTDSSACSNGQVCCATGFGPGNDTPVAECADMCGGGGPGNGGGLQLCATDAECAPDEHCSEGFGGLMRCRHNGGGGPGGPGGP